ncbi:flagellar M-ring protein FliF [Humitalea rosea]|uniref:Flagellar M-ring protein n=1 Tax=Humitalea rosea TaxID=990373 RepID=A0A2W7IA75_9PROT|nr:flagellar basal-body MS-ring/collar protein FliF [Humitalea rosea]PZW43028.1 flagellar M-ring protein FliF [Humitalea rosea]
MIDQLRSLGTARLAGLAGVGVAVLGLVLWLALRAGQPAMALLYADLDARDAGQVVAALERQHVPYRLGGGGAQVFAPEEQVARLRLALARDGLPAGGSVGYEIFDRGESLTTTPFQQDVNRLRALEGELARTIRGLSGVRGARVHLVLPRREPFSRERGEAQASVVLTMQGAQRLDREGVQAVLHLVSMAVPGLRPQGVSIVDSRGELLARGGQALNGPAGAASQEEARRALEMRLARAVEEMLERSLGQGRVRAEVSAEMDFERVTTVEERFDPDNQVPRSTQTVNEQNRSGEGGVASVATQLPGAEAAAGPQTQESRQEETTNFEIGRTTRNVQREHPVMKRLSVAVLVDGVWEGQPRTFRERTPEELQRLVTLVRGAVGFDERRGDHVEVVSLRFAEPPGAGMEEAPALLGLSPATVARLIESSVFALVALVALLAVARPVAGKLVAALTTRSVLASAEAGAAVPALLPDGTPNPAALGAPGTMLALTDEGEDGMVSLANIAGQMRASSLARLAKLLDAHPEEALGVIRGWLHAETPQ